jgi:hypothetical protein
MASCTSCGRISVWNGSIRNCRSGTPFELAVVMVVSTANSTASQICAGGGMHKRGEEGGEGKVGVSAASGHMHGLQAQARMHGTLPHAWSRTSVTLLMDPSLAFAPGSTTAVGLPSLSSSRNSL